MDSYQGSKRPWCAVKTIPKRVIQKFLNKIVPGHGLFVFLIDWRAWTLLASEHTFSRKAGLASRNDVPRNTPSPS